MEKTLYPGRGRLLILGGLSFCFMMAAGGVGALIWAVIAVVFGGSLLPKSAWLKLDEQGFTIRMWYREQRYRWSEVSSFVLITQRYLGIIPLNRFVGFRFIDGHPKKGWVLKVAAALAGFDRRLPDNYGMRAKELATLLEAWRLRAAPEPGTIRLAYDPIE